MAGEKPTSKALQLAWQGTLGPTDSIQASNQCKIVVIGVGDAGNNIVTQLTKMGTTGIYTIAINTDSLHLSASQADQKMLIGEKLTRGLGVDGDPTLGRAAIGESRKQIEEILTDVNVVFVTAGLGGGTGTGAAPVVAEIGRKKGAITIGVVTKPFRIEKGRMKPASRALTELRQQCDTVVVIDNNKLTELVPQLPIDEAFKFADKVLANLIKGIVETISTPSLINLDFADFRTIVKHGGVAVVGIGESNAPNRAEEAVRNALKSPLLDIDCAGATGALIHVTGDSQMTIEEANHIGEIITEMMNNNAQVIWGARVNPEFNGRIRVTLVMTGINPPHKLRGIGSITPQLFNLEPYPEPEKKLPVDLGLYQLENFET
ncbi:MAG: cell division protein FtsZ [Candidatus Bathyarchaeota archaeon]|nr:cell division protein FtsZ [Candidatus Bathyarchaeota archaeon]MDH5494102.1 cell division protein FtsZ [Candidatus Bathyarchaeota archaeon]